jgi:hypothetical protein
MNSCSDLTISALTLLEDFCFTNMPVTKKMLPNLVALLKFCHESGQKSHQLYFLMQQSIEYYYYTEGNCLFFDDTKDVLSGEKDYDMTEINLKIEEMQGLNMQ